MGNEAKVERAREFVRGLNNLLKSVRLYGLSHEHVAHQLDTTWEQLRALLPEAPVVLGVSGSELLLDGAPIGDAPVERGFADLLSSSGVSSLQFNSGVTQEEFQRFVGAFAAAGTKPKDLAGQLRAALAQGGEPAIGINEVRFVAEGADMSEARLSAQLAVSALGIEPGELQAVMNDPQKLLQFILAAEGAHAGAPPSVGGRETGEAEPAGAAQPGVGELQEAEMANVLRLLAQLGQGVDQRDATAVAGQLQKKLAVVPAAARTTLKEALAGWASVAPSSRPQEPTLLRLAEHLAIRYALERYQRGEVQVNAVRELLDRMSRELINLRKLVGEQRPAAGGDRAGAESPAGILAERFWGAVPDDSKRELLTSTDAWWIPAQGMREFLKPMLEEGEEDFPARVLGHYADYIRSPNPEARHRVARGLSILADLYAGGYSEVLDRVISDLAEQLAEEPLPEVQRLLTEAFVHLTQESAGVTRPPLPSLTLVCQGCGEQQLSVPRREPLSERVSAGEIQLFCGKCRERTGWSTPQPEPADEILEEIDLEVEIEKSQAPEAETPAAEAISSAEQRRSRRVRVKLPIRVRCDSPELSFVEETSTLNFSRHGVLFHSRHALRKGMQVFVLVPYNKGEDLPETPARVVRVRPAGDQYEVALSLADQ